jgi:hypothetical protein
MECNFPWNKQPIKMKVLELVPIDNVKSKEDISNMCQQCQGIMEKGLVEINESAKKK